MTTQLKDVKNNIAKLRKARGWSMDELAKRAKLSKPEIMRIEKGIRKLSLEHVVQFSEIFNVLPDEIVSLPFKKIFIARCDEALLGHIITYLMAACSKYGVEIEGRNVAKWATYIYNEARENPQFDHVGELAFNFVKAEAKKAKKSKS